MSTATTQAKTDLQRVVEVNEGAKAILGFSHQINLKALDAIVRGIHAGRELRGFSEVSSQMRQWSAELHEAVRGVSALSARQIDMVSSFARRSRMAGLMREAAKGQVKHSADRAAIAAVQQELNVQQTTLNALQRSVTRALEDLQQLGLMASVLARTALIEAASGNEQQRRELSEVSKGFSEQSENVNQTIVDMLRCSRESNT